MVYLAVAVMLIYGVAFMFYAGLCVAAARRDAQIEAAMARDNGGGGRG